MALKGGEIKKNQMLSGDMASFLSNLYLAHGVCWMQENNEVSAKLSEYCLETLLNDNRRLINRIIVNYHAGLGLSMLLLPLRQTVKHELYEDKRKVVEEVMNNPKILEHLKENIIVENTVLAELEELTEMRENNKYCEKTEKYEKLYKKVISVGEYEN